ncbi:hypothetical protein F5B19DRAFT_397690 [Rostrohypoxylon terebratum]|nr:hypothetical protein F5B19DRAFT_397690 [Rostrohypoxylon terebratum]
MRNPWKCEKDSREENLWQARYLVGHLENIMSFGRDENDSGLVEQTKWEFSDPDIIDPYTFFYEKYKRHWRIEQLLLSKEANVHHISCFLIDNAPLPEKDLATSELRAIWTLTEYQQAKSRIGTIPVTILSCSGLEMRIVKGVIDFEKVKFHVRVSPIIPLPDEGCRTKVIKLCCSVIGEPIKNIGTLDYGTV